MLVLVLDDLDMRHEIIGGMLKKLGHKSVHVKDFYEAIKALEENVFDEMFLDHDLEHYVSHTTGGRVECEFHNGIFLPPKGCYELTGLDVVHRIVALPTERLPKKVTIHSWNPSGANNMKKVLQDNGIEVIINPFNDRWIEN